MIKKIMTFGLFFLLSLTAFSQTDNNTPENNTVADMMRIQELNTQKDSLLNQIKIEDAKRNMIIDSLSFEQMEIINDRQDSICLDLRSKLTYINLELKELEGYKTSSIISDKMNQINQNNKK